MKNPLQVIIQKQYIGSLGQLKLQNSEHIYDYMLRKKRLVYWKKQYVVID